MTLKLELYFNITTISLMVNSQICTKVNEKFYLFCNSFIGVWFLIDFYLQGELFLDISLGVNFPLLCYNPLRLPYVNLNNLLLTPPGILSNSKQSLCLILLLRHILDTFLFLFQHSLRILCSLDSHNSLFLLIGYISSILNFCQMINLYIILVYLFLWDKNQTSIL